MSARIGGGFLKDHYEWIAVAVAVAALVAGAVMFAGSLGVSGEDLAAENTSAIDRLKFGGEAAKAADMTDFTTTTKLAKNPPSLSGVTDAEGCFLASERRVFCGNAKCAMAVSSSLAKCPYCGFECPKEEQVADADGDGLPDEWEMKHFSNLSATAEADADGDGFSNQEEFQAKTAPNDAKDHPDYLDSLQLELPLKQTFLPFTFTGAYKTPSGMKFQFKDPSRAKEYDRGTYSILAGAEIGKTGFTVKEYVQKSEKIKMGGGMTKTVDVSEAIVVRKGDGKAVRMKVGAKQIPVDVQATLVYARGEQKKFSVVAGDEIDLNGSKYTIKSIGGDAKKPSVTIEQTATKKIRVISPIAQ